MEKRRLVLFLFVACALVVVEGQAFGQNQVPAMPKHPKDILLLAARMNGLGAADMKPWHLKAAYEVYDADGNPKYQGSYEEWWAAPDKYKVSFSDPGFHQVEYVDGGKLMITGDAIFPFVRGEVESELTHPLPPAYALENGEYDSQNVDIGGRN